MTDDKAKEIISGEVPAEETVAVKEAQVENIKKIGMLDELIGDGYNAREVRFVMVAAVLIAMNNGFVNGVCLSGFLFMAAGEEEEPSFTAMVSGTAGAVTNNATNLAGEDWTKYFNTAFMFLSYMIGAFIVGGINPRAKAYAIVPGYSPCWIVGGTMLLAASLLSAAGVQTRGIFYLCIAANGVQNGIASIYSANLIRCTLTGAFTDIGLVIGQCLHGNFTKIPKATVLAVIIASFWLGGVISFPLVRAFRAYTLLINAAIFYLIGVINISYLVVTLKLSVVQTVCGTWDWKDVLNKIQPSGSKEDMMALFNELDHDKGGTLDMYELRKGLLGKVSEQELQTLLQAADMDGSGDVDLDEWTELVDQLFIVN